MSEYQWGVHHLQEDGSDLGVIAADSEPIARETLVGCAATGTPCELVRREIGPWVPLDDTSEVA